MATDDFDKFLADLHQQLDSRTPPIEGERIGLQQELQNLDLRSIAAFNQEDRDPASMGRIEALLHKGDTSALDHLLGREVSQELVSNYLDTNRALRGSQGTRSVTESVTDPLVAAVAGTVNMPMGLAAMGTGLLGMENVAAGISKFSRATQEKFDEFLSDDYKGRRNVAALQDESVFAENEAKFKKDFEETLNDPYLKQLEQNYGKDRNKWPSSAVQSEIDHVSSNYGRALFEQFTGDAKQSVKTTVQDPALLAGGMAETAASMGTAIITKKAIEAAAKPVLRRAATKFGIELGEELTEASQRTLLRRLGSKVITGTDSNLDALAWAGANALLEGPGAYQEAASNILLTDVKDLEKTSEPFRDRVAELKEANPNLTDSEAKSQAQRWLANQAGRYAGLTVGVAAAGISHVLGQAGKAPIKGGTGRAAKNASGFRAALLDAGEESLEEGAQGFTSGLVGNLVKRELVDPNQSLSEGVGGQTGEGALLGALSTGSMRVPGAVLSAPGAAINAMGNLADKRRAEAGEGSLSSYDNLVKRADEAFNSSDNKEALAGVVDRIMEKDPGTGIAATPSMMELVDTPIVKTLPESHSGLSAEHQALFTERQNRVEAVETAAKLLKEEKDPARKTELALFLSDLLEPARRFQETPTELETLKKDPEAAAMIGQYQEILSDLQQLPSVKEATVQMREALSSSPASSTEITQETLATPEGQQTAKVLAAQAVINPGLNEKTSAKSVQTILTHGTDGKGGGLTPAQRAALKGSLALLQAREAVEGARTSEAIKEGIQKRHLYGAKDQTEVGREVTVDQNPDALVDGKYSSRQHTDMIINAAVAGNKELARRHLVDFAKFLKNQQHKIVALNSSLKNSGKDVSYQQLLPDRSGWRNSSDNPKGHKYKYEFLHKDNKKSVEHAQTVAAEADLMYRLATGLNTAYDLGVKLPAPPQLNSKILALDTSTMPEKAKAPVAKPVEKPAAKPAEKPTEAPAPAPTITPEFVGKLKQDDLLNRIRILSNKKTLDAREKTLLEMFQAEKERREKEEASVPKTQEEVKKTILTKLKTYFSGLTREGKLRAYYTDQATGLLNKTAATVLPRDPKRPFLAVFGLEGKKFLNDEHKHTAYDGALRVMARVLTESGITDGMKIGGDVQAWVKDEAAAQQIADRMEKEFPGFRVITGGIVVELDAKFDMPYQKFKTPLDAAYEAHGTKMGQLRKGQIVSWRKAPPQSFMKGAPQIAWEDNQKGFDLKSKEALAFIAKIRKLTEDFGQRMRNETTPQKLALPPALEAHLKAAGITEEQMYQAAYYEPNTGLLTLQGWETVYPVLLKLGYQFTSLDLRALKPMNDKKLGFGEQGADQVLYLFGKAVEEVAPGAGTWLHGDEFAAAFPSEEVALKMMEKFEELLAKHQIFVLEDKTDESEETTLTYMNGLQAAWGVGSDFDKAETDLAARKEIHDAANKIGNPVSLVGEAADNQLGVLETEGAHFLGFRPKVEGVEGQDSGGLSTDAEGSGTSVVEEKTPTVSETYPKLYSFEGKVRNFFQQAFQFRKRASTNLQGKTGSLDLVRGAIGSSSSFKDFTGKDPKAGITGEISQAYQKLLETPEKALEKATAWIKEWHQNNDGLRGTPRQSEYKRPKSLKGMQNVGGVMAMMQANLDHFLGEYWITPKEAKKAVPATKKRKAKPAQEAREGVTWRQALEEGRTEVTLKMKGKVINVIERDADGNFRYNPELLEQASLAAVDWQITASKRHTPAQEEEVAALLGLEDASGLKPDLVYRLSEGESLVEAKQGLASTIRRFWGVQGLKNQGLGLVDGIPEAMAGEMLRALENLDLVEVKDIFIHEEQPDLGVSQAIHRYVSKEIDDGGSAIYAYPDLLQETIEKEPEARTFYGPDAKVPVKQNQLAHTQIENSKRSNTARKNMQDVPFYLNMPMVKFFLALDEQKLLQLFGNELPETKLERKAKYNKNDLASLEGQNLSLTSAWRELKKLHAEMQHYAGEGDIAELEKRYQYAVTSVNRSMMLGAHNPQSSKIMREALMSTWSTLDISGGLKSEQYQYLMLAVAQALGRRIHEHSFQSNVDWAHEAISGPLSPAINLLIEWHQDQDAGPFPVEALKVALEGAASKEEHGAGAVKVKVSPLSIMALTEMARMGMVEDLTAFETPLYLESDGMTNGPMNATGLLAVGSFSGQDIATWRRGGLSVGSEPMTADKLFDKAGGKDNYRAGAEAGEEKTRTRLQRLLKAPNGKAMHRVADHLFTAMSLLFEGDLKWEHQENGDWHLTLSRGLAKNPITVMVYGSGNAGIANKFGSKLANAFYEKLSILARVTAEGGTGQEAASLMFPGVSEEKARENARKLWAAMEVITGNQVVLDEGKFYLNKTVVEDESGNNVYKSILERLKDNPQEFTFIAADFEAMQTNLRTILVDPLKAGVEEVLNPTVFSAGKLMIKATKEQAGIARELYYKAINGKIGEKIKALESAGVDPVEARNQISSEFLSRDELNQIWNDLVEIMPIVKSDGQHFLLAKNSLLEFWDDKTNRAKAVYEYSRSLDDKKRTGPNVKGIDSPGVAAIPYMVIGMGDGRMVREIFQKAIKGAFQVYDGVNLPVDRIAEYGSRINEAALKAWQGNVFESMLETYSRFADHKLTQDHLTGHPDEAQWREDIAETRGDLEAHVLMAEARRIALSRFPLSMDQMAGTYQPFVSKGELTIPENATDQQIAELLNVEYLKALEELRQKGIQKAKKALEPKAEPEKKTLPLSVFDKKKRRHKSGAWVLTKTALFELPKMFKGVLSQSDLEVLGEILRSGSLGSTKVVMGTRAEVAAYQTAMELTSLSEVTSKDPTREIHGFYSPLENTVYLMSPKVETLLHELIHASTYGIVRAHYEGKNLGPKAAEAKAAIARLENLMKLFLETDFGVKSPKFLKAMEDAKNEIQSHIPLIGEATSEQKAAALNEFMAWTLANQEIAGEFSEWTLTENLANESIEKGLDNLPANTSQEVRDQVESNLKKSSPSRLAKLTRAAFQAIKKLVWGRKTAPNFGADILSQIRFNTAVLSRLAPSIESKIRDITLAHATLNDGVTPSHLREIREVFGRKIAAHLEQNYTQDWVDAMGTNTLLLEELKLSTEVTQAAKVVFNGMSQEAVETFQMITLAFTTEAQINPQSLIAAQRLYEHFLKDLKQEDFLTGKGDSQADMDQAIDKFQFLFGQTLKHKKDPKQRSTLLPVFIALAMVDDGFRSVLSKKNMPEKASQEVTGLDSGLQVLGSSLLDKLEDRLTSTNQPVNVKVALDQLAQGITRQTLEAESAVASALEASGKATFGLNAKVASMMQQMAIRAEAKGDSLVQSGSVFDKALGRVLQAVNVIISDDSAVSEDILSQMDRSPKLWASFKDLVGDMVGRVPSQAEIYDMVNKIRAGLAQSRQAYREMVPYIINSKFKTKLNQDQHDTLYRLMGRYDMAALLETMSVEQALELAGDPAKLKSRIAELETELKSLRPSQAARYEKKINQYVKFVQTGIRGGNLLRNAIAISELLGEPKAKNWTSPTSRTVEIIDQLITLQLLEQSSKQDHQSFQNLLKHEKEGVTFILNYLKGQRKTELAKAETGLARYNHYKGALPSERKGRGHLTVVENTKHTEMLELGYTWVGSYIGSSIESKGVSKSYYFSPEGGVQTPFSQGIAQNIHQTAYGVSMQNGHSTEATAGRIMSPVMVDHLASLMNQEVEGPANLSPIYNEKGKVVAFERSLDPKHLKLIEQPQNLAKMIGHWRGRQIEEVWAAKINEELVNHLHRMWETDQGTSGEDRYINLFDTKDLDPVVRDAVALLTPQLRELAQEKFGYGKLMVRANLVNMTVGYRNASVGDMWTGNTRWSKSTQEIFQKSMISLLGLPAYRKLLWAERNIQAVMASVRTNIVVRSIIVPMANTMSGIYQLRGRGVPIIKTMKAIPGKVTEIEYYTKSMSRKIQLEAERFAKEGDIVESKKIDRMIQGIEDNIRRLSIWPLIEAGEFSTISDVGQTYEDLGIGPDNLMESLTSAVDKLPPGLRDLARQGYISRDTALFQFLQKSVQYSDFIMKSIYYDHMMKMEKVSSKEALGRVTEEFNNYNIPTGRTRGYVESIGMAWFLNYKIRATKIALSMLRRNPVDLLLYATLPTPFGSGIPVTDNIFASLFRWTLPFSVGPGMALEPIAINPWYNLLGDLHIGHTH